jgi:virginiamycin A acetyltransferase
VIRQRFTDETISRLEKLAWWDWPVEKITQNLPAIISADLEALPDE